MIWILLNLNLYDDTGTIEDHIYFTYNVTLLETHNHTSTRWRLWWWIYKIWCFNSLDVFVNYWHWSLVIIHHAFISIHYWLTAGSTLKLSIRICRWRWLVDWCLMPLYSDIYESRNPLLFRKTPGGLLGAHNHKQLQASKEISQNNIQQTAIRTPNHASNIPKSSIATLLVIIFC